MEFGQTVAVLIIAAFILFMLWGRSANGQAWFSRVYGVPTPKPSRRQAPKRRASSDSAPRTRSPRARGKSATKRGRTR